MKEGLNIVHLSGYVNNEPCLYKASTGAPVLRFRLSVPRQAKDGTHWKTVTDSINIAVWGWKGKNLSRTLSEGSHIYIGGHLRYSNYEDKRLKKKVVSCHVQAEQVLFLGEKPSTR